MSATAQPPAPVASRRALLWLALLLGAALATYWPGLTGGFVFDDFPNIVDNTRLHVGFGSSAAEWIAAMFSSPASAIQRPLAMLTFAFNHALTGLDPYWMKLTNVGIHLANTVLVYGLCLRLLRIADGARAPRTALWIAAAWSLNPINLTAVLFVVQRMESLCHTFVFAGLSLYVAGRARLGTDAAWRAWLMVVSGLVVCTGLGAAVKESAVLLPLYAFAIEWALLGWRRDDGARDRRLVGAFGLVLVLPALLGLAWLLPGVASGSAFAGRSFTAGERLLTEGRVVVDYLGMTLLPQPARMGLYHDDYVVSHGLLAPPATLLCLLALGALFATMVLVRRRRPLVALGIAWFLCAQLLTATIVPLELMFEHRNYFASLGVLLALGDLLLDAPSSRFARRAGAAVALILPLAYAGATTLRGFDWSEPLRFSVLEAAHHPQSPRAAYDLARNYVILSRYRADSPYLGPALATLDRAMRIPGSSPLPDAAALVLAERTGRPVDATWWHSLQAKLRDHTLGPQETTALASLVQCQIDRRCHFPRDAMADTFSAARRDPPSAEVLSIEGNYVLNVLGDAPTALTMWQQAVARSPGTPEYLASVARLLIATGRAEDALPVIARLRATGRVGQHDAEADALEREARQVPGQHGRAPRG